MGSGTFTRTQFADNRFFLNLGDLDGNGSLDIFAPNNTKFGPGVWFNNGSGTFTGGMNLEVSAFGASQLGDIDGDQDLDVIVAQDWPANVPVFKFINDGNGNFTVESIGAYGQINDEDVLMEDFDGDGDKDLWIVSSLRPDDKGEHVFLKNDGSGNFTEAQNFPDEYFSRQMVAGDIDNDGDIDVVGGEIFLNEGDGTFTIIKDEFDIIFKSVAMGDFNGDNYLDIFVSDGASSYILMNKGQAGPGGFEPPQTTPTTWNSNSDVQTADVDNDGDSDIVGEGILLNDGSGQFTVSSEVIRSTPDTIFSLETGDLNGDGAPDIAFVDFQIGGDELINVLFNQPTTRQLEEEATVRILVGDVPGPVDISISRNNIRENMPADSVVGDLTTLDPTSNSHTYTLINGAGSENNADFAIVGNQLISKATFDYEAGQTPTRRIRIHTTNGQLSTEKSFVIYITNEEPEPKGPPEQCNGGNLTLYDSGDGEQSAIVSGIFTSNNSNLGCKIEGTLNVQVNGQTVLTQLFTGQVNRWNKLSSSTNTLNNFSFDIAGVTVRFC